MTDNSSSHFNFHNENYTGVHMCQVKWIVLTHTVQHKLLQTENRQNLLLVLMGIDNGRHK